MVFHTQLIGSPSQQHLRQRLGLVSAELWHEALLRAFRDVRRGVQLAMDGG
jgi:hypothetical protein